MPLPLTRTELHEDKFQRYLKAFTLPLLLLLTTPFTIKQVSSILTITYFKGASSMVNLSSRFPFFSLQRNLGAVLLSPCAGLNHGHYFCNFSVLLVILNRFPSLNETNASLTIFNVFSNL